MACLAAAALAAPACEVLRDRPEGGQHPAGWIDPASGRFHGAWLRDHGHDMEGCRACHGPDDGPSPVGSSCSQGGCHEAGVSWCGTCHGKDGSGLPASGAHARHGAYCAECHSVPESLKSKGHIDGTIDVVFSGLAVAGGATPAWSRESATCAGTYCHQGASHVWETAPAPAGCGDCHGDPPSSHARFAHAGGCETCHPKAPGPQHVDGSLDVKALPCDTCHGKGPLGAPPAGLEGTAGSAGAHGRHLDGTLDDRIGRVVSCEACHVVPESVSAPGHLDGSAPADVFLAGQGTYDAAKGSCMVGCHWDRAPGPVWTDTSGSARACDACHGFPPALGRDGTPHTPSPPSLDACRNCHVYDPLTHVDGHVDLVQ